MNRVATEGFVQCACMPCTVMCGQIINNDVRSLHVHVISCR